MNQEIATRPKHQAVSETSTLKDLLATPAYRKRLEEILKERAPQFVASLIQVGGTQALRDAEPNSIVASAITAAVLDLPIDKTLGFAHIVPYKTAGRKMAQFQIG